MDPVSLAGIAAAGAAVGPILYSVCAVGGVGLAAASFLTTAKPAGLHHASEFIYQTFEDCKSSLEHIRAALYSFDKVVGQALDREVLKHNLLESSNFPVWLAEVKQLLQHITGSLSATNNQKLARAFQGLHLLVWHIQQPVYEEFWQFLRHNEVMPGEISNLIEVFDTRHPAVKPADLEGHPGTRLAIASTHLGWFVGMNNWKEVFVGDLPGRLSANDHFQPEAKSSIQFERCGQNVYREFLFPEFVFEDKARVVGGRAHPGQDRARGRSDSMDSAYDDCHHGQASPSKHGTHKLKADHDRVASKWSGPSEHALNHGDRIRIQVEGDHYLYQPWLELDTGLLSFALTGCQGPRIGKYFMRENAKDLKIWQIQHVTADLVPSMVDMVEHLPFVLGDRVAFFFQVWWGNKALQPLYPSRVGALKSLGRENYEYALFHRPKREGTWSDKCVFTLMAQSVAAGWSYGHVSAH